jgi:hypothetical protein
VRKGLGHINKALEEAQAADDSLNNQGLHAKDSASEEKKKEAIARKMRALTAQIQSDFKKVTGFGDKAGYVLRPVLLVSLVVRSPCLRPCLSCAVASHVPLFVSLFYPSACFGSFLGGLSTLHSRCPHLVSVALCPWNKGGVREEIYLV